MEDPGVPLERNLYGHPLAGPLWERQFEKIQLKYGFDKFKIVNAHSLTEKMCILICICGRCQTGRKETEHQFDLEKSHEIR